MIFHSSNSITQQNKEYNSVQNDKLLIQKNVLTELQKTKAKKVNITAFNDSLLLISEYLLPQ